MSPKLLLIIDLLGAILSAFLIGVILVNFQGLIGMPYFSLYFLAALPLCFAIFDFIVLCYWDDLHQGLRTIASANICYCVISLLLTFYHSDVLITAGWVYFITEIIVVAILAMLQIHVAKRGTA